MSQISVSFWTNEKLCSRHNGHCMTSGYKGDSLSDWLLKEQIHFN